jgi:hypothetical protein
MKINYEHTVDKIRRVEGGYILSITEPKGKWIYRCERLIVATGLGKPNVKFITENTKRRIKHYAEYERDFFAKPENLKEFENKSLAIIGNGNSAYELGNALTPVCSSINIIGKRYKPMAMSTHYAGDMRSIYAPYLDTFSLKSLNAVDCMGPMTINQESKDAQYTISYNCGQCPVDHNYLTDSFKGFDHVIFCTGWAFDTSIFDLDLELTPDNKYPAITPRYESVNNPNLFFIGSLMHSLDYKKSSGGFIHGFRYLIEYFFHIHYDGKLKISKFHKDKLNTLVSHILYRINYSSALYQMYGQVIDAFIINTKQKEITYIENVTYPFLISDVPNENLLYFTIAIEYSKEPPETDTTKVFGKISGIGTESKSRNIHPVLRVHKDMFNYTRGLVDEIHFDEDLFANYTDVSRYKDKLIRVLKAFI